MPILLYSKILSKEWPRYTMLSSRIKCLFDDRNAGMTGAQLKVKYQTRLTLETPDEGMPRTNRAALSG